MSKTKLLLLFFMIFLLSLESQAQIKDILKNQKDKIKDKAKDKSKDLANTLADNELSKMRNAYDTTNFNYSIALSDNSGLFEDKQKGAQIKKFSVGLTDIIGYTKERMTDPLKDAKDANTWGSMCFSSNRYKFAEKWFNRSQRLYEQDNATNNIYYPQVLANKGLLFESMGRYNESLEYTQKALEIRKTVSGENSSAYASSINNLAMVYKDLGRYNESEQLINQALSISEKNDSKNSVAYVILLNNKAMILQSIGRYQDAEKLMQESLKIAEPFMKEKSSNFQRLQVNLALLYQEMKRFEDAEKIYLDAIKTKERRLKSNHPDLANMKNNLAALYLEMGKNEKIEPLLKDALRIYEREIGKTSAAYANTLSNLGNFYRIQGKLTEAEDALEQTLDIRREALGEQHPSYSKTEEDLALVYWQTGNIQEAANLYRKVLKQSNDFIQRYFPPMSEAEKGKYWDKLRPVYLRFYSFATQFAEKDPTLLVDMYDAHLATKAILLSATNKIKQKILNSGNKQLIDDYNTWIRSKEDLAKLYTYSKEDLQEQEVNLDSLERVANDLEKKLSASSQEFTNGYEEKPVTYNDIISKLTAGEAVLDIISFQQFDKRFTDKTFYVALVASKEFKTPKLALLDNGNELDGKYFKYYRNKIQAKQPDKESYNQYWGKIEPLLAGKTKIFVSLDGVYNQISLNGLQKADGKYLIDEKTLIFLTSTKDLLRIKSGKKPIYTKNATLFGFPDYGTSGAIPALPGTKKEVDDINAILTRNGFKTNKLMTKQATEESIKKVDNPRILHIATHGFFLNDVEEFDDKVFGIDLEKARENPLLRSGLMLANAESALNNRNTKELQSKDNGILTAYEAMNMSLDKTEIVLMSACETGLGDVKAGEGVYGLQRAFSVAGADALIMSLWTVSDAATQDLMTLFFQNWVTSGNKSDAFRKAQQQLKLKYKEPYFWSAFLLIGN